MAIREVILPMPHQGQKVVRLGAKRHNVLVAGRRWRKTTLVMAIAVEAALAGKQILWAAPTFDQVRIGWEETKKAAVSVANFNETKATVTFPGGGRILYRSLDDPDNARGHTADGLVIDEAAEVKKGAWDQVLRPMLMDTGGWSWLMFTPKGRNWAWAEWSRARDDANSDSAAWQAPTLGVVIREGQLIRQPHALENPFIPFDEIKMLWERMTERAFRQEILAEFVEDAGGIFRNVRNCVSRDVLIPGPEKDHQYVVGADWGKLNDWSVFTVLDTTTNTVVYLDRMNQVNYELQLKRLKALCERFQPMQVVAERNSMGEPLIESLQAEGLPVLPFTTTATSKAALIDSLVLAFEKNLIRILPNDTLIEELEAYQAERLPSGTLRYGAPEGLHDDCVMSLGLAWHSSYGRANGGMWL